MGNVKPIKDIESENLMPGDLVEFVGDFPAYFMRQGSAKLGEKEETYLFRSRNYLETPDMVLTPSEGTLEDICGVGFEDIKTYEVLRRAE